MSNVMRYRRGETNPVFAPVDSATVIEIGDLLYYDTDDAKPASSQADGGSEAANQATFAPKYLGVAEQQSRSGDTAAIRVATDGVFEMDCASSTFEIGDYVAADENGDGDGLLDQTVVKTTDPSKSIGIVVEREPVAVTSVLVRLWSNVCPPNVLGTGAITPTTVVASTSVTTPLVIFSGATGANEIQVPTNLADALSIEDAAGDLIVIDTTTGAQRITVTPATTFTGVITSNGGITLSGAVDLTFSGTTGQSEIVLTDNLADALSVKNADGTDIIVFTTTNGSEAVTVTPLLTGAKIQPTSTAVTATADGLTTGLIPAGASFVTVTCDNAAKIITLPAPVPGHVVRIMTPATGCELRTVAGSNVKINDVDSDGSAQAALAADSHFVCECISATEWIVRGFTKLGDYIAAIVPDAP